MLFGCRKNNQKPKEINADQLQKIASLCTVKGYYHNVIKSNEETGKSWYEFWRKDKIHFWVEYDAEVEVSFNMSNFNCIPNGNKVVITLPYPEVTAVNILKESLNDDSYYFEVETQRPNADQQVEQFKIAEEAIILKASEDIALMEYAKENAKEILTNYVNNFSSINGVDYETEFVELPKQNNGPKV